MGWISSYAKTPQEAPQQPKKKNKADIHAKKKQHRIDRIAKHWTLFSEPEARTTSQSAEKSAQYKKRPFSAKILWGSLRE